MLRAAGDPPPPKELLTRQTYTCLRRDGIPKADLYVYPTFGCHPELSRLEVVLIVWNGYPSRRPS